MDKDAADVLQSSDDDVSDSSDSVYDLDRVEDEDWEITERGMIVDPPGAFNTDEALVDFTKQYNRLRQHVAIRTGDAACLTSSISPRTSVAQVPPINQPRSSTSAGAVPKNHKNSTADQLAALAKYSSRIANIHDRYTIGASVNPKGPSSYANFKDKSDRATSEQVLDPRTRIIIFKMIGRGMLHEVNGCISTGKEVSLALSSTGIHAKIMRISKANVYHAITPGPSPTHLALKIYKTSILIFKDRDKYVTGEFRFRRGYSRHNPRKMVRLWAEKEMRNLRRLFAAGIPCPEPIHVKDNVLVMGFLGDKNGW
jgi:RIO kinase 1